jgi:ribosomal protein L40E
MDIPPMAWAILALGVLWLALRYWQNKQAEERAAAREERMNALLAEREKLEQEPPSSLGAVVSDSKAEKPAEKRCLGCRTVNPPDATTCAGCGLEL